MALSAAQIVQTRRDLLDRMAGASCKWTKPDIDAAAAAIDTWCTANQASFVAALPEPFKSSSTAGEKATLLAVIAIRRYGG